MRSNKDFSAHHISTAEVFATTKFAANDDNSLYFVGADTTNTYVGVPDIKYEDYCIIKPYGYTYTHGRFNVQSIQSADATHLGLADALEVKNALATKEGVITGAASTITTANLTASKVLGSDANGKVAATSISISDAEDAVAKRHTQNTDTKIQSGNNKVEVSASGTSVTGNASVSGDMSVSGNLNVIGKETVEEIVNIKSENNFITLRDGAQTAIASGSLSGTKVENYDGLGNDLLFGTDASGTFRIGDEGGTLEPIATRDEATNLTDGQLMKWDAANQRLVGTSDIAPQINSYVASKAMTEDAYWDLVAAGTVQQNTLYITFDNDWEV